MVLHRHRDNRKNAYEIVHKQPDAFQEADRLRIKQKKNVYSR